MLNLLEHDFLALCSLDAIPIQGFFCNSEVLPAVGPKMHYITPGSLFVSFVLIAPLEFCPSTACVPIYDGLVVS
jgi:hypothetical protein